MLYRNLFPSRAIFVGDEGGGGDDAAAAKAAAEAAKVAAETAKAEAAAVAAAEKKRIEDQKPQFSAEYVQRLRDEAAAERTKATEAKAAHTTAQAALDKIEADKLKAAGEHEKLAAKSEEKAVAAEARAAEIQAKADERLINAEIKLAAQTAGMVDPADALAFIDRTGVKLDGESVVGVAEAIAKLKTGKAHLFKPGGKQADPNAIIAPGASDGVKPDKQDAFKMKPDEFKNEWDKLGTKKAA